MGDMAYMCKNRHGTYYARFIIPKHLQSHFENKKEIRRSLQTDSRKLAVKRARVYRVQFESIVDQLMSKVDNTSERAKQIIDSLFAEKIQVTDLTATHKPDESLSNASTETKLITFVDALGNKTIFDHGGDIEKENQAYQLMLAPSDAELAQREKCAEELHQAQLAAIAACGVMEPAKFGGKKVSEYLDDYIAHKITPGKKGGWSAATARQKPNKLNVFRSVFGDKPAESLTRDDMEHYVDIAYRIPSNFENPTYKKFKDITLDMILTGAPEIEAVDYSVRGAGTVKDDLKTIRAFLSWVLKRKDATSLQPAINALDNEISDIDYESDRRAFTDEELRTLLQNNNPAPENYVKGISSPIKFWLPFLAVYTGARIAEICQLHTSDIKLVKSLSGDAEHWCIDINEDGDKKLKNKHSKRQIPIHQNLITAGLVDYADDLRAKGEATLFPELNNSHNNFATQWFGIYSDQAGVTDKDTAFHSFRHVFCSYLAAHHVPEDLVIALSGHQYKSLAKSVYDRSRKRDVGKLAEVIDSINYGLTHPKWKSY
jgi:integrase